MKFYLSYHGKRERALATNMKVVHLVTTKSGGAYRAAARISEALSAQCDSSVLTCTDIRRTFWQKVVYRVNRKLCVSLFPEGIGKGFYSNDMLSFPVAASAEVQSADIVHIHWVAAGMLSLRELRKLVKTGKPIVWTLHDMHPFTGGCHYDNMCEKYKEACGACPQIGSAKKADFSTWNQKQKKKILQKANICIVGCSEWIARCARESRVMSGLRITTVPNCIDVNTYKPYVQENARKKLNISAGGRKIIAFGAMNATSDPRKGFHYLRKALQMLNKDRYMCVIIGEMRTEISDDIETVFTGYLSDDEKLALYYAAADVFVAPSVQENLANTVMEALACGTPVAAFDIGGMPDLIKHGYNGYLAAAYDADDLANGIEYCCQKAQLRTNAREYVLRHFQYEQVAEKYLEVYADMSF